MQPCSLPPGADLKDLYHAPGTIRARFPRRGLGVGRALLCRALALALDQRDRLGCVGVLTDAKPDAVAFYEQFGFAPLPGLRQGALPGIPTPLFLPIAAVAAAAGDSEAP